LRLQLFFFRDFSQTSWVFLPFAGFLIFPPKGVPEPLFFFFVVLSSFFFSPWSLGPPFSHNCDLPRWLFFFPCFLFPNVRSWSHAPQRDTLFSPLLLQKTSLSFCFLFSFSWLPLLTQVQEEGFLSKSFSDSRTGDFPPLGHY